MLPNHHTYYEELFYGIVFVAENFTRRLKEKVRAWIRNQFSSVPDQVPESENSEEAFGYPIRKRTCDSCGKFKYEILDEAMPRTGRRCEWDTE